MIRAHILERVGRRREPVVIAAGLTALGGPLALPNRPSLVAAAVLVPLIDRPGGMTVLLTQRTDHLKDHAGQISFPGGRVEPGDDDVVAAALRESEEEIGLDPARVQIVGRLDTCLTGTGFSVAPVVGLIDPPLDLALDRDEVAAVFEVPLSFVLDARNHQRQSAVLRGVERHFFVLDYDRRYIWGATARMLVNLHELLAG